MISGFFASQQSCFHRAEWGMNKARKAAPLIGLGFGVGGDTSFPGSPLSNSRRARYLLVHSLSWGLNDPVRTRVISQLHEVALATHTHTLFSQGTSMMLGIPL